jgi:hypothetical protein
MKREVMEAAGLESFAEIGIIIFFITFLIVALRALLSKKSKYEDVRQLPLEDDEAEVPS